VKVEVGLKFDFKILTQHLGLSIFDPNLGLSWSRISGIDYFLRTEKIAVYLISDELFKEARTFFFSVEHKRRYCAKCLQNNTIIINIIIFSFLLGDLGCQKSCPVSVKGQ